MMTNGKSSNRGSHSWSDDVTGLFVHRDERSFNQTLRNQQDAAYEASLRADQEKERRKREQQAKVEREQQAERDKELAEQRRLEVREVNGRQWTGAEFSKRQKQQLVTEQWNSGHFWPVEVTHGRCKVLMGKWSLDIHFSGDQATERRNSQSYSTGARQRWPQCGQDCVETSQWKAARTPFPENRLFKGVCWQTRLPWWPDFLNPGENI